MCVDSVTLFPPHHTTSYLPQGNLRQLLCFPFTNFFHLTFFQHLGSQLPTSNQLPLPSRRFFFVFVEHHGSLQAANARAARQHLSCSTSNLPLKLFADLQRESSHQHGDSILPFDTADAPRITASVVMITSTSSLAACVARVSNRCPSTP